MSEILVYTGSTGAGHKFAAQALRDDLKEEQISVSIIDLFKEKGKFFGELIGNGYQLFVEKLPNLYRFFYWHTDEKNWLTEIISDSLRKVLKKRIIEDVAREQPKLLVSTHPFISGILGELKLEGYFSIPILSIITDYVVHELYLSKGIDAYLVANDFTKERLIDRGVRADKIYPYGIPIRKFFRHSKEVKESLSSILIMAGSLGNNSLKDTLEAALKADDKLVISVVCGADDSLEKQLKERYRNNDRVKIYGFIDRIDQLFDQNDLLITKPGGLTTSEAITKNIPMIFLYKYPGVEEENARFLVKKKVAYDADNTQNLIQLINYLSLHPDRIKEISENQKQLSEEYKPEQTIKLCKNLLTKQ